MDTDLGDIPEAALDRMRRAFVDTVGTTYGGVPVIGRQLAAYARDVAAGAEAVVIGNGGGGPAASWPPGSTPRWRGRWTSRKADQGCTSLPR